MADNKSLTEELEERLDIFFGEDAPDEDAAPARPKSSLETLKSVILSLEWEITDRDLDKFLTELETLKGQCNENSIECLFLKLLDSIARYIKVRKANAHPNTITLLNNAFQNYTSVVEARDISENEKKTLLLKTINEFKDVKAAIAKEKKAKSLEPPAKAHPMPAPDSKPVMNSDESEPMILDMEPNVRDVPAPSGDMDDMTPHEAFALALQEIRKTIEKEFQALRAELRMWRNGQ
jgi:hypothetical protein